MNDILAQRMKRRKFKTKFKNYSLTVILLALLSCAGFFAISSYADDQIVIEGVKVVDKKDQMDILHITNTMYLSEMTLDGFKMKTDYLKIENDEGVCVDNNELQYIFQYCSLWGVKTLDLSDIDLLETEFTPRILIPCKSVKKIILPDNITKLGDFVFYEWINLTEINMPRDLVEIGKATFSGCKSLNPVEFGTKIERIGEQAFLGCEKFEYIVLPNTIKYLGKFSFADCVKLKELTLPNNDDLEIDGLLMASSSTIISVYYNSQAYKIMLDLDDDEFYKYVCKNKILIKPEVSVKSLKKMPNIKETKKQMMIGENLTLDDFINIDLNQTGVLSYKLELCDDGKELYDLNAGSQEVKYNAIYYLSDLDLSDLKFEIRKVDNVNELVGLKIDPNTESRFFLLASTVKVENKLKIKVLDYTSKTSKNVKALSEKYSKTLNLKKHTAYMSGFKDGTFRPKDEMTNAEVATIIARLNDYDEVTKYETYYYDVNPASWNSKYIGYVTEKGIMTGKYNFFRPNEKITRGEFVIAISKMIGLKPVNAPSSFADVWGKDGENYIAAFEKLNIIGGLANGSFGYSKTITRAEACHIINLALGRTIENGKRYDSFKTQVNFSDVKEFNWFYKDVLEATVDHYEHELH